MDRKHFGSALTFVIGVGVLGGIASTALAVPLESWDNQMNTPARFKVLQEFNNEAVLDKETQLVWEKTSSGVSRDWTLPRLFCADQKVGGRKGWRLPSLSELASLVDPSQSNPALPPGHPFHIDVRFSPLFWSATTDAQNPDFAWAVDFGSGHLGIEFKALLFQYWCVRGGGMNADRY